MSQKIRCLLEFHKISIKWNWSDRKIFTEEMIGTRNSDGSVLVNEGSIVCEFGNRNEENDQQTKHQMSIRTS